MSISALPWLPHVEVDFNVRSSEGLIRSRLSHASSQDLSEGDDVWVIEPHERLGGLGTVARVDRERGLVYLNVDLDAVRRLSPVSANTTIIHEVKEVSAGKFGLKSEVPPFELPGHQAVGTTSGMARASG